MPLETTPSVRAAATARWAATMTRCAIRFASTGRRAGSKAVKRWQFVGFAGPAGAESRGIVDLIAIRRDHGVAVGAFQSGDLFEIVLLQIKGGSAPWPSVADQTRLMAVRRRYRAKAVVLSSWKEGSEPRFYELTRVSSERKNAWTEVKVVDVFGSRGRPRRLASAS